MGNVGKYFDREEFSCKGTDCGTDGKNCGFNAVDAELVQVLDDVREHFGKPVMITSGCRCRKHNAKVGGAKNSTHVFGIAADIRVKDIDAKEVYKYLDEKYSNKYGIGKYTGWTHIDVRTNGPIRW